MGTLNQEKEHESRSLEEESLSRLPKEHMSARSTTSLTLQVDQWKCVLYMVIRLSQTDFTYASKATMKKTQDSPIDTRTSEISRLRGVFCYVYLRIKKREERSRRFTPSVEASPSFVQVKLPITAGADTNILAFPWEIKGEVFGRVKLFRFSGRFNFFVRSCKSRCRSRSGHDSHNSMKAQERSVRMQAIDALLLALFRYVKLSIFATRPTKRMSLFDVCTKYSSPFLGSYECKSSFNGEEQMRALITHVGGAMEKSWARLVTSDIAIGMRLRLLEVRVMHMQGSASYNGEVFKNRELEPIYSYSYLSTFVRGCIAPD
ncbi:hypothetical protein BJ508DRAFT_312777 [Ascobolus immersus RN42]|uniref:Uncharacterized protein n=1 Tax=Ascobolus immersus RN42 TaxID=1160509 RepID=A0A3N4HRY5_ASCIM|nr:hypothetical protein BJ508DRAFT_312777 [Ascobolus immersus RN42]